MARPIGVQTEVILDPAKALRAINKQFLSASREVFDSQIVPEAKRLAPILKEPHKDRYPGQLRDSIAARTRTKRGELETLLYTQCGYGGYVELGRGAGKRARRAKLAGRSAREVEGRPFLYPAFMQFKDRVVQVMKERLAAIKDAGLPTYIPRGGSK